MQSSLKKYCTITRALKIISSYVNIKPMKEQTENTFKKILSCKISLYSKNLFCNLIIFPGFIMILLFLWKYHLVKKIFIKKMRNPGIEPSPWTRWDHMLPIQQHRLLIIIYKNVYSIFCLWFSYLKIIFNIFNDYF